MTAQFSKSRKDVQAKVAHRVGSLYWGQRFVNLYQLPIKSKEKKNRF